MSPVADDQIRAALARRSRASLTEVERANILRAARLQALQPRRRLLPRFTGWLAAAVAAVVLVVIAVPVLLSSPIPVARASSSPVPTAVPATSPTPTPAAATHVYSGQDLSDMVGNPTWIGRTVLAEASIGSLVGPDTKRCPPPDQPCGVLEGVTGVDLVHLTWRDATAQDGVQRDDGPGYRWATAVTMPTAQGVFAFTIGSFYVELLGPAQLAADGEPLTVANVPRDAERTPTDNVYVVSGWWYSGSWPPCPVVEQAMQTPQPESDYFCEGSWITASRPLNEQTTTMVDGALQLPAGPYPSWSDQQSPGAPVHGIFVVRSAGCQIVLVDNCPVWRLLGRLDNDLPSLAATPSPTAPIEATFPQPSTSPVAIAMPRGVDLDQAIEIARPHVGPDATLWGYAVGTYRDVLDLTPEADRVGQPPDGATWDTFVWGIVFEGTVDVCGPPSAPATSYCFSRPGLSTVYLDYQDGTWLTTAGYSPKGPLPTPFYVVPLLNSPAPTSSGSTVPEVYVSNGTTLRLAVAIDGQAMGVADSDKFTSFDPNGLPEPWRVTLTTESGRLLVDMTYRLSDIGTDFGGTNGESGIGVGQRLDLSCGRVDVHVGGPILGGTFIPSSSPGDCEP